MLLPDDLAHNNKISDRKPMKAFFSLCSALVLALYSPFSVASDDGLSEQIRQLKNQALNLNRDLTLLERELLYATPQTSIFVSVDVGTPIRLVDINLTIDGEHVGYHFYTDQEFEALTKGGIQRLYTGNLTSGRHELEATITGYDPQGKDYQKTTSYAFTKGAGKKMVEMQVVDDLNNQQHKFEFREWNQQ
ncbi:hypothetical protein Y5S_03489 [Alcanivorax nanhaiticus]|uniref:AraC family transcriptional regulator n=2 Tax=Alcanivorax nanhaiticus TaxID=1177154 RepID=A0A095SFW3_9GAMM|nr:hypothetical protein Y5S_03489 [Alcanivorax nanhaiticus]